MGSSMAPLPDGGMGMGSGMMGTPSCGENCENEFCNNGMCGMCKNSKYLTEGVCLDDCPPGYVSVEPDHGDLGVMDYDGVFYGRRCELCNGGGRPASRRRATTCEKCP